MELLTPGGLAPIEVQRYLVPHERPLLTVRHHPAMLLPPIASAVGGAVVSGAMRPALGDQHLLLRLVQVLAVLLFVELLRVFIRWRHGYIVLTDRRLMMCSGLFGRRIDTTPLASLEGVAFRKSASGHLLGYGTIVLQGGPVLDFVPFSEHVYLELEDLFFPSLSESDETSP